MVDNTSVVIAHGTGKDAQPAETLRILGERFGFYFEAHAVGDANRSARVERRFHYIENNFYPGRSFADLADLNSSQPVATRTSHPSTHGALRIIESNRIVLQRVGARRIPVNVVILLMRISHSVSRVDLYARVHEALAAQLSTQLRRRRR